MRALLDTSVVIAADVGPSMGSSAISSVTLGELHFGVLGGPRRHRTCRTGYGDFSLRRTFDALPLDEAVAASYGQSPLRSWMWDVSPEHAPCGSDHRSDRPRALRTALTRNVSDFHGLDELPWTSLRCRPPHGGHRLGGLEAPRAQHRVVVAEQLIADRGPGAAEHAAAGGHRVARPFGDQVIDGLEAAGPRTR